MLPLADLLGFHTSAPKKSDAKPAPDAAKKPAPDAKVSTASGASAGSTATSFAAAAPDRARDEHSLFQRLKEAVTGTHAAPAAAPRTPERRPTDASTTLAATTRDGASNGSRGKHIDLLESQISSISTKQALIDILPAALPGIGLLGKLVMDKVVGDDMNKEVNDKKGELETEKTINFMAQTLYALGAPQTAVNALDGSQKINVVDDKTLASDAEFDSKTGAINVSQSLVNKVAVDQKKLLKQGIINANGAVLDQERLNKSGLKENTVKIASLVGAHEATHATQQATGVIDQFKQLNDDMRKRILGTADNNADTNTIKKLQDAADTASNLLREHMLEYDAYHNQELTQIAAGAPGKVHVTIDTDGKALPFEHAVQNITAFETDTPLMFGPDAGIKKSDIDKDAVVGFLGAIGRALNDAVVGASASAAADTAAASSTAGDTTPGGKFPGGKFPGGKFPGDEFPGGKFPGGKFPGGKFPGDEFPGGKFPGGKFPGGKFPGDEFPGGKFPGGKIPGG
ncbi:MAG: hypothetical protein H7123_03965, partial [Thermoleophilia bacterium]|nr:hypothetical protein [Thermoleophilia bacterium]